MNFSTARLILIIVLQISLSPLYSQSSFSPKSYVLNLKYHYGFILNHSQNMVHLANQRPMGIEIDIYKNTNGRKIWEQVHNYPYIGYAFQYFNMNKDKPLGDTYSLIIYYENHIFRTPKSSLSYRIGVGPAYIEKRFDRNHNYKNNLISTRLNFTLNGQLTYYYSINKKWNIQGGIGIIHFSNGGFKVPNLGINIPSIHVGIGYCPPMQKIKSDTLPFLKKELVFNLSVSGGLKQVYPVEGPSYLASTLTAYANKRVNRKSSLNVGTDVFFDASNKTVIDTLFSENMISKYFKWGITIGHEFHIGKTSLLTQLGVYVYDPLKLNKSVYQRIGLKYSFTKTVFGNVCLKTHFGQADFVEWGLGISL